MRNDEFNQNISTNDNQLRRAEYGKTQHNEFSDGGEMHLKRSAYNANLNQTVKNTTTQPQETFVESSSASSSAAVSSSGASGSVTITAGTSASTIAASTASAAVVASSVAITAISVVTGVSVIMHDYKCDMKSLFISSNQMTFELTIEDLNNENKDPDYEYDLESYEDQSFNIRVFNNNYEKKMPLYYGYNTDSFTNLTLGESYKVVVPADDVSGSKTLYEESFTTTAVANFFEFNLESGYDYTSDTIYAYLDFVDEIDQLSDFTLKLTRVMESEPYMEEEEEIHKDEFSATYVLEKKIGTQEIVVSEQNIWIEIGAPYKYEFSYKRNNEVINFKSGDVTFYDMVDRISEVYGVAFNNEANYYDKTFEVRLEYVDENYLSDNFVLHLAREQFEAEIPLLMTTSWQVITASQYNIDLEYEYEAWLTYNRLGEEERLDLSPFAFTDNSGLKSEFYEFIFPHTADFVDKTFEVRLDYEDGFDIYHEFVLNITDNFGDFDFDYELDESTITQTISAPELLYDEEMEYNYSLTCMREGISTILDTGSFKFTDKLGRQAVFNEFIFSQEGNFLTNEFDVQLDYIDTFNAFTNFNLNFSSPSAVAHYSYDFALEKTTNVQHLNGDDKDMYLMNGPYNYTLTVERFGELETLATGTAEFTDTSGAISQYNGLVFNQKMDYETGEFTLTLQYQDDFDFFSDFKIRFYNDDTEFDETINLEKTTNPQTILGYEYEFEMNGTYTYIVSYSSQGVPVNTDPVTFTFQDLYNRTSEFNEFIFDKKGNFLTNEFDVQLDYTDPLDLFSNFVLEFSLVDDDFTTYVSLEKVTTVQTIDGDNYDMPLRNKTYHYVLRCDKQGATLELDSGDVTFTDISGAVSEFNEFIFDGTANRREDVMTMQLDYTDDFGIYSDFILTLHNEEMDFDTQIELENTTEEQSFTVSDYDLYYEYPYTYTLTCLCDGVTTTVDTGEFTFTDSSGMKSEMYAPTISSSADYKTRAFSVTLDFVDDFNYFSDIVMTVRDTETNNEQTINLSKTTDPQFISFSDYHYNEDTGENDYDIDILDHTVIYSITYRDNDAGVVATLVESEPLPAFTNSLSTEFNGLVSNWKLVESTTYAGQYYIPMKLDYVDEKGIYGYMEINMYIGDDQVGVIEYANEVVPPEGFWIAGSVSTSLTLEELTSYDITFKVEGQIMDEKNNDIEVEPHETIYQTTQSLSLTTSPEIIAVTADNTIFGVEAYFQTYFSGRPEEFTNTQIIIETENATYTYTVVLTGLGDSLVVDLMEPDAGTMDSVTFDEVFNNPVTIKFSYCTINNEDVDNPIISEPYVITCYVDYRFAFSV